MERGLLLVQTKKKQKIELSGNRKGNRKSNLANQNVQVNLETNQPPKPFPSNPFQTE